MDRETFPVIKQTEREAHHSHTVPKLRMSGSKPSLSIHFYVVHKDSFTLIYNTSRKYVRNYPFSISLSRQEIINREEWNGRGM